MLVSSCTGNKTVLFQFCGYLLIRKERPYGNPVPYKQYWKAYEDIMREYEGRSHWAKVDL